MWGHGFTHVHTHSVITELAFFDILPYSFACAKVCVLPFHQSMHAASLCWIKDTIRVLKDSQIISTGICKFSYTSTNTQTWPGPEYVHFLSAIEHAQFSYTTACTLPMYWNRKCKRREGGKRAYSRMEDVDDVRDLEMSMRCYRTSMHAARIYRARALLQKKRARFGNLKFDAREVNVLQISDMCNARHACSFTCCWLETCTVNAITLEQCACCRKVSEL